MSRPEMFDYFEMQGDSFVIFDVDEFRSKTKALAITSDEKGVFILDGETLEWYSLPIGASRKRQSHVKPVT